jgi:hypothetical protein
MDDLTTHQQMRLSVFDYPAFYGDPSEALRTAWLANGYGVQPYPDFEKYPEFKGLFVGGCVKRGIGSSFRHQAHAHNYLKDPLLGWICVRSPRRLCTASGKPSQLMLHEVAHLLCTGHGHDDLWRATARSLGYRLQAHERKRIRNPP